MVPLGTVIVSLIVEPLPDIVIAGFVIVKLFNQVMPGKTKSSDDTRSIDMDDEYAIDFWTRELSVTQTKLKAAQHSGLFCVCVRAKPSLPSAVWLPR